MSSEEEAVEARINCDSDDDYPHGVRLVLTIVSVGISVWLVGLDGTIVSTAIPAIVDEFHALSAIGWFGSVYFLTTAMNIVWGKAYKYFPLKAGYMSAIFLFELGSLICGTTCPRSTKWLMRLIRYVLGVAPNATALIIGRAIAGAGGAGLQSGGNTIVAFSTSAKKRPVFIGALGACYTVASALGPIIGGALTSNATWRWCFYINLPIGGLAFVAVLLGFRTPRKAIPPDVPLREKLLNLNPISYALWCVAMVCYLLAMQYGGQLKPWNDPMVIGTLVGFGGVLVAGIIWDQSCGERALIQARLFKIRAIAAACPFVFFLTGKYSIMVYFISLYFQSVTGASAQQSGIRTFALVLPLYTRAGLLTQMAIFFVVSGIFIRKVGYYKALLTVGSAIAATAAGLTYSWDTNTSAGPWIGYQILLGAGMGMSGQGSIIAAQASVGPSDIPQATASVLFFQNISGAFFISAADCAFANQLKAKLRDIAPAVDPQAVYGQGGAANLAKVFSGPTLASVLKAYMSGLRTAYALALASGGAAFLLSFAVEWRKVNVQATIGDESRSAEKGHGEKDQGGQLEGAGALDKADSSS